MGLEADRESDTLALGERDNLSHVSNRKNAESGAAAMSNPSEYDTKQTNIQQ